MRNSESLLRLAHNLVAAMPNLDDGYWFLFRTGYETKSKVGDRSCLLMARDSSRLSLLRGLSSDGYSGGAFLRLLMWGATKAWKAGETRWE